MNFKKHSVLEYINHARSAIFDKNKSVVLDHDIPYKFYKKGHYDYKHNDVIEIYDYDSRLKHHDCYNAKLQSNGNFIFEVHKFRYSKSFTEESIRTNNFYYSVQKKFSYKKYMLKSKHTINMSNDEKKYEATSNRDDVTYKVVSTYNNIQYTIFNHHTTNTISETYTHKKILVRSSITAEYYTIALEKRTSKKIGSCTIKYGSTLLHKFEFDGEPSFMRLFNNEFLFNELLVSDELGSRIEKIREVMKCTLLVNEDHFRNKIKVLDEIEHYKQQ